MFFQGGIFIIGLFVGSLLNCVIYRLYQKESFLKGRSFCPKCKHLLAWYDLVPVLSFIILHGRCRYCQKKISWQYPLVEIATSLVFLQIFNYQFPYNIEFSIYKFLVLIYYLIIASFLIIIFVYDLKHYLIPDKIVFSAIFLTFSYRLFEFWSLPFLLKVKFLLIMLLAILPSLFFLSIILLSRGRWMGLGDFKLAVFMGFFLGWPDILVAMFLSFLIGAIIGLSLIVLRKKNLKSELPFGPFLVIGTFLSLFFGQNLINWYLKILIFF